MTTRSTMRSKNTEKSTRKIFQITFRRQIPGVNIKRFFYRDIHSETLVYLFCKFEQIFRRPSPKPAIYLTPRSTTLYFVMYFSLLALSFLFLSDRFRVLISFFSLEHFFFRVVLFRGQTSVNQRGKKSHVLSEVKFAMQRVEPQAVWRGKNK